MGEPESVIFHAICAEPRLDGDQILLSVSSHRSSFFPSDMGSSKKHETASDRRTYFHTLSKSVFICPPLDCVSRYHIHDFLHSFQVAFRSDKRTLAYLSFTTCEKAPPLLSFKHMCISKLLCQAQTQHRFAEDLLAPFLSLPSCLGTPHLWAERPYNVQHAERLLQIRCGTRPIR